MYPLSVKRQKLKTNSYAIAVIDSHGKGLYPRFKEKLDCHKKSDLIEKILSGTLIDRRQPESPIAQAHQQLKSVFHQWAVSTRT